MGFTHFFTTHLLHGNAFKAIFIAKKGKKWQKFNPLLL